MFRAVYNFCPFLYSTCRKHFLSGRLQYISTFVCQSDTCTTSPANVSLLIPFTKKIQNYSIGPGQVANVPQGWWHYEEALQDNTHLLAIFNEPAPEVILGSDILKFTPANIMANTYCIDENQWKETIAQVQPTAYIGPANSCSKHQKTARKHQNPYGLQHSASQPSTYPANAGYWPVYPR
jgi:hypothetical protein